MTIDDKKLESDIWIINNDFNQTIKSELLTLAKDLNITFIDEESLKFEDTQMDKIDDLISKFAEEHSLQGNILELIHVD